MAGDELYVVKHGDTLWDISRRRLGNPERWRDIVACNATPRARWLTGSTIVDPDLIVVGQKILIPAGLDDAARHTRFASAGTSCRHTPRPSHRTRVGGIRRARVGVRGIPFKYDLRHIPPITLASPAFTTTIKLSGSVTIQSRRTISFAEVSREGFEIGAKREADLVLQKLVGNAKVGYNPGSGHLTFEIGMTIHAHEKSVPSVSLSSSFSGSTGLPCVKASMRYPSIRGHLLHHLYAAADFGGDIEMTPDQGSSGPNPLANIQSQPMPLTSSPSAWHFAVGGALIGGAAILITATLAEDVVTLGGGILDDAASFAAASAMFTAGMASFARFRPTEPIIVPGGRVR
jgi:hypothetical protein